MLFIITYCKLMYKVRLWNSRNSFISYKGSHAMH